MTSVPAHAEIVTIETGATDGSLWGEPLRKTTTMESLRSIFSDQAAAAAIGDTELMYRVEAYQAVPDGTDGGLFFGTSFVSPGLVGDEYFMTRGHFHTKPQAAEYYWCISGEGCLILMDQDRRCWAERMRPGSVHYIPGFVAHRLANVGNAELVVGACWPSDAGHDYDTINNHGFSALLLQVDGKPRLVAT